MMTPLFWRPGTKSVAALATFLCPYYTNRVCVGAPLYLRRPTVTIVSPILEHDLVDQCHPAFRSWRSTPRRYMDTISFSLCRACRACGDIYFPTSVLRLACARRGQEVLCGLLFMPTLSYLCR